MSFNTTLYYLISIILISGCSTTTPKEKKIIPWGSEEGIHRLEESVYKIDFFKLANNFDIQNNKLFCGPATATTILNSLRLKNSSLTLPEDKAVLNKNDLKYLTPKTYNPSYDRYSQDNIFLENTKQRPYVLGKPIDNHTDFGFQLRQFADLFEKHGAKVTIRVVNQQADFEQMKQEILENLKRHDDYVAVNYKRSALGQPGGGHISPIGAYHQDSDSFLIMDVIPSIAEWVWVKADFLFEAMQTCDTVENRGYLLISE
jgi:hypothetical protein